VSTSALTDNSLIFVTPDGKAVPVGSQKLDEDTFKIILNNPSDTATKVNWWIIN
jgi:hypothetical protein